MKILFYLSLILLNLNSLAQNVADTPIIGNKILPQKFITLDSTIVEIGNQKEGKFLLVDFYFTKCRPCNTNIVKINRLNNKFINKLDIISVNPSFSDTKESILNHRDLWKIDNPIIFGKEAEKVISIFKRNKMQMGYPFYILINPNNEVIFTSYNSSNWHKKIEKLIQ